MLPEFSHTERALEKSGIQKKLLFQEKANGASIKLGADARFTQWIGVRLVEYSVWLGEHEAHCSQAEDPAPRADVSPRCRVNSIAVYSATFAPWQIRDQYS